MDEGESPHGDATDPRVHEIVDAALLDMVWQPVADDDPSALDPVADADAAPPLRQDGDRSVPAALVREAFVRLATDSDASTGRGPRPTVHVACASLEGDLDLSDVTADIALALTACHLGRISLPRTELRAVRLERCSLDGGIHGEQSRIGRSLDISRCRIDGGVDLDDARIDGPVVLVGSRVTGSVRLVDAVLWGQFICRDTALDGAQKEALHADRATITGGAFLNDGFTAAGEVRLLAARISGLDCSGATLSRHAASGDALSADGAQITGDVVLDDGFHATGTVRLPGATLKGDLNCRDARLDGDGASALRFDNADISGNVFLTRGCTAVGEVRMLRASVGGQLNCEGATFARNEDSGNAVSAHNAAFTGGVFFNNGFSATGTVELRGATLQGGLYCEESQLDGDGDSALSFDNADITGNVFLTGGCTAVGEVRLLSAGIDGQLNCGGATLARHDDSSDALSAHNAVITGGVFLNKGFSATGTVQLWGATLKGGLHCEGARLDGDGTSALNADGADLSAGVALTDGFSATGSIRLQGARLSGNLNCHSARLDGNGASALSFDNADITGNVFLTGECTTLGEVRMLRASIGGQLNCEGATLARHDDSLEALSAHNAAITGDVFLNKGFSATGTVQLWGATLKGGLHCEDAQLDGDGASALSFDNADITGNALLSGEFSTIGTVNLRGATIRRQLSCQGAALDGAGHSALNADRATVVGGMFLTDGFTATGEVRLLSASIGGQLSCRGATLVANGESGDALSADNAEILGHALLTGGFHATGPVRLPGAMVSGGLACHEATLRASSSAGSGTVPQTALDLTGTHVAGELWWQPSAVEGEVDLTGARVSSLADTTSGWGLRELRPWWRRRRLGRRTDDSPSRPGAAISYRLAGFTYAQPIELRRSGTPWAAEGPEWRKRVQWLNGDRSGSLQPYAHLAEVYRLSGHENEASHILYHGHRRTASPGRRARLGLIGYGYRPRYALLLALLLLLATWQVAAAIQQSFVPTEPVAVAVEEGSDGGPGILPPREVAARCAGTDVVYPCFSPFVFALETVVPLVELDQRGAWQLDTEAVTRPVRWSLLLASVAGWAIALLIAAGFTRAVRRD